MGCRITSYIQDYSLPIVFFPYHPGKSFAAPDQKTMTTNILYRRQRYFQTAEAKTAAIAVFAAVKTIHKPVDLRYVIGMELWMLFVKMNPRRLKNLIPMKEDLKGYVYY